MNVAELRALLAHHPDDMPIRLLQKGHPKFATAESDFSDEHIILTSDTAYADDEAPQDQWDSEEGKIELGDGERYLLINPIIS